MGACRTRSSCTDTGLNLSETEGGGEEGGGGWGLGLLTTQDSQDPTYFKRSVCMENSSIKNMLWELMVKSGSPAPGGQCSHPSNRKCLQSQIRSQLAEYREMQIRKVKTADA